MCCSASRWSPRGSDPGAGPARSVKHADDLGTDVVATAIAARG